jgi:hypothetical protein
LPLLGSGCASTNAPATGNLVVDLKHQDPRVRIDAAMRTVAEKRLELAAELVDNLSDRDGAVRLFSAAALRKLTGQDFAYKPHGTPEEQRIAIERWRLWLAEEGRNIAQDGGAGAGGETGK